MNMDKNKLDKECQNVETSHNEGVDLQVVMRWIPGEPTKAMWCLATYKTNDEPLCKAVAYLWFNPHSIGKWWIGTAGRKCLRFTQSVTHWMPVPRSA
jgi:hypothetical protein